jgi:hypothetical protein
MFLLWCEELLLSSEKLLLSSKELLLLLSGLRTLHTACVRARLPTG